MCLQSVCVTCNQGGARLQTAIRKKGREGSQGKSVGGKKGVGFDSSENESILMGIEKEA